MKTTASLVVAAVVGLAALSHATDRTWSGPPNGNWFEPAYWNPPGVPTGEDVAIVNDGAVITGTATIVIPTELRWNGGVFAGVTVEIATNAVARLGGESAKTLVSSTFINRGRVDILGAGNWMVSITGFGQSTRIENREGAHIEWSGPASLVVQNPSGYPQVAQLENRGVFRCSGDAAPRHCDVSLSNAGTFSVVAGTMEMKAGGSGDGRFEVAAGGALRFVAGAYVWSSATFAGAGQAAVAGPVTWSGSCRADHLELVESGSMTGSSEIDGKMLWSGGTLWAGSLRVTDGLALRGDGPKTLLHFALSFGGAGSWDDKGPLVVRFNGYGQAVFMTNLPGGEFRIRSDGGIRIDNPSGYPVTTQFQNQGAIRWEADGRTNRVEIPWLESGETEVLAGLVQLAAGSSGNGTFRVDADAQLRFSGGHLSWAGARFLGDGAARIDGVVTVSASVEGDALGLMAPGQLQGSLNVAGRFAWTGGTMAGATVLAEGGLQLDGDDDKVLLSSQVSSGGTARWGGLGRLLARYTNYGQSVLITNREGATWVLDSPAGIEVVNPSGYPLNAIAWVNEGTLRKTGSGAQSWSIPVLNAGKLSVEADALELRNGGGGAGEFTTGAGARLKLQGGRWDFAGARFTGTGRARITGPIDLAGTAESLNLGMEAGGQLTGSLDVAGRFEWEGGRMISGRMTVGAAGLHLAGPDDKRLLNYTLENKGAGSWTGDGNLIAERTGYGQVVQFVNATGATFRVQTAAGMRIYNPSGYPGMPNFDNAGLFDRTAGAAVAEIDWVWNNSGIVHLAIGGMELRAGGVCPGRFVADAGASLRVAGGSYQLDGAAFQGGGSSRVVGPVSIAGAFVSENFGVGDGGSASGSFVVQGSLDWSGGGLASGEIEVSGGLRMSGAGDKVLANALLRAGGEGSWSGPGRLLGRITGYAQRALVHVTGNLRVEPGVRFLPDNPSGFPAPVEFRVLGAVRGTSLDGTNVFQVPLVNEGVWETGGATWICDGGLVFSDTAVTRIAWKAPSGVVAAGAVSPKGRLEVVIPVGGLPQDGAHLPLLTAAAVTAHFSNESGYSPAGHVFRYEFEYLSAAVVATVHSTLGGEVVLGFPTVLQDAVEFVIQGQAGLTYVLEASEDLVTWREVQRTVSTGPSTLLVEPWDPGAAARFHRVALVP